MCCCKAICCLLRSQRQVGYLTARETKIATAPTWVQLVQSLAAEAPLKLPNEYYFASKATSWS